MAFTTVESIRSKIGDRPRFNREQFDGDGVTNEFRLQYAPVLTLPVLQVWVANNLKTEGTDYTVDYTNGVITFPVAPAANAVIIAQYTSVVWSDLEIDDFYAGTDDSVTLASARMLYAWAARLAVDSIKETRSGGGGLGAVTIDTSVRAREMRASADALMRQWDQFEGVGEPYEGVTEVGWTEQMRSRQLRNYLLDGMNSGGQPPLILGDLSDQEG